MDRLVDSLISIQQRLGSGGGCMGARPDNQRCGLYGKSHPLLLPDALIAATAKIHGMTLATLNTRDFPMTDIQVLRPYRHSFGHHWG